ncbi:MAG: MATE family efflux transporter [Bacillota bacterium]|nr:MATE family efflux transporter [Bacillota bacterium]
MRQTRKEQMDRKTEMILKGTPIWKGMLQLAIPVFFVNILKTVHDLVDTFFLGRVPGIDLSDGIANATHMQNGVGITWSLFFIFISFGMGLSVAGAALIGQYIGHHDPGNAKKYAGNLILMALGLGFFFNLTLYVIAPWVMRAIGAVGADYEYAVTYLRIRSFELPILFFSYAFQAIRQSTGDTTTPVLVSSFQIVLNIVLTWWMVSVLDMGVVGAGLSTLIANWVGLPAFLLILTFSSAGLRVDFKERFADLKIMKHLLEIAIPASVGQAIQALGFVILNGVILSYGTYASTAYAIGNRINSIVMFPVSAVSAILAIYIAQNVGAGDVARARASFRTGMTIAVAMMTIGAALIIPFRIPLVMIMNSDPLTLAEADRYMLFLHLGLPFMGVYQTFLATFQGSGETRYGFWLSMIRLWAIRLPLVYLMSALTGLGTLGVWSMMLVSNFLSVFVGIYLYRKVRYVPKIRRTPVETEEFAV